MVFMNQKWTPENIKALRKEYRETQRDFATRFRVGLGTLRCWEQGQYPPSGPATVILDQLACRRFARRPRTSVSV